MSGDPDPPQGAHCPASYQQQRRASGASPRAVCPAITPACWPAPRAHHGWSSPPRTARQSDQWRHGFARPRPRRRLVEIGATLQAGLALSVPTCGRAPVTGAGLRTCHRQGAARAVVGTGVGAAAATQETMGKSGGKSWQRRSLFSYASKGWKRSRADTDGDCRWLPVGADIGVVPGHPRLHLRRS